jgi:hypothetical protein
MIESPLRGLIIKVCAGFVINTHLLITIAIIFEKVIILKYNTLADRRLIILHGKYHSIDNIGLINSLYMPFLIVYID